MIAWSTLVAFLAFSAPGWALANDPSESCSLAVNGGRVLPPIATPKGWTLARAARTFAYFNTGPRDGAPPHSPFQELYVLPNEDHAAFEVEPGTVFYVPILFVDDSEPVLGNFPPQGDRRALIDYWYSQSQLGLRFTEIIVDGTIYSLGSDYLVRVTVPELGDGNGTGYLGVAAFLTPLPTGVHDVRIRAKLVGDLIGGVYEFSTRYTVTVR